MTTNHARSGEAIERPAGDGATTSAVRGNGTSPKVPRVLAPVDGQPLMIAVSYARRASAERHASIWNMVLPIDGLAVAVGPPDENGDWPLVWVAAHK